MRTYGCRAAGLPAVYKLIFLRRYRFCSMAAQEYRPRNSTYEVDVAPQVASGGLGAAPTTGAPSTRPVPAPRAAQRFIAPQQQMPQHPVPVARVGQPLVPVQTQMMPPPYYPIAGAGTGTDQLGSMPRQQQQQRQTPYQVQETAADPLQQPIKNPNSAAYKMQYKVNFSFCTFWKGILEIVARIGIMVSFQSNAQYSFYIVSYNAHTSPLIFCNRWWQFFVLLFHVSSSVRWTLTTTLMLY